MSKYTPVRAARGTAISCKGWQQEGALRMLMNNLDEEVAENPRKLIVYGGSGRAARSWDAFHAIVSALRSLENQWHKIYIGWQSILGQLKVQQRQTGSKSVWSSLFGKKKS